MPEMAMPPFLVELAIEPKSRSDIEPRLRRDFADFEVALNRLAAEDEHGFDIKTDRETGQTVVRGLSEQHLEWLVDRMGSKFGIAINAGAPQVAYRETLGRRAEIDYTHKRQRGGSGEFARIKLVFEPGESGSGYHFESRIVGGAVPKEYIPGVERGLKASCETGVLAGFPVIDFKVTLVDGAYHDVDSSVTAFEIAAWAAFKEGLAKAQCKLLEPIMKVEVVTPEDCLAEVIGDLNTRRGQIRGMEARGDAQVIDAMAPLANMFGYVNTLRSMTQRRAAYTMAFGHYAPVPLRPDDDDPFAPAVGMHA
jgi:elongation factor G